jgi:hypothetical protein
MRRIVSALFLIALVLGFSTPVASAEEARTRPLTGTFEGGGVYQPKDPARCPDSIIQYTGTYELDRGGRGGTYTMDMCMDLPVDFKWAVYGTFEIVTGQGFSLTGTAEGYLDINDVSGPMVVTLTVTDSPGARRPIRGTIAVDGFTEIDWTRPPDTNESGTFRADLRRGR